MKPSHSASFGLNSDDAAAGCLLGILGRILCGSMPTAAAGSHVNGEGKNAQVMRRTDQKTMGSPSVVARLMGLDSMPVFPYASSSPDSLERSRSANSADSWPESGCSERRHGVHAMTSMSFREAPTYLRQENEDFLLLSFSPEDGNGQGSLATAVRRKSKVIVQDTYSSGNNAAEKKESRRREDVNGNRKKNKKKIDKSSSEKENLPEKNRSDMKNAQSNAFSDVKSKNCVVRTPLESSKVAARKKLTFTAAGRLEEVECISQDSSPVSVLDHHPYVYGESCSSSCSSPTSGEEEQLKQNCSRRISTKFEVSPFSSANQNSDAIGKGQVRKPLIKSQEAAVDCTQIWGMICMLTEDDVTSTSWISKEIWRLEEVSEITAAVALDVLDLLLQDAVSEMCSHILTL